MKNRVEMLPMDAIAEFCRRWKIQEMALLGSVLMRILIQRVILMLS